MKTKAEFMEERRQFICGASSTMTAQQIALECGCSYATVVAILRASGLHAIRPMQLLPESDRNLAWIAAYESGEKNASEIAKEAGVSRERVCQILRPHRVIEKRIERRKIVTEALANEKSRLRAEAKKQLEEKLAPAIELVRAGYSRRQAAIKCGLDYKYESYLNAACNAAGLPVRTSKWADFSERRRRCEELAAEGLTIWATIKKLKEEGDTNIHASWIMNHMRHCFPPTWNKNAT